MERNKVGTKYRILKDLTMVSGIMIKPVQNKTLLFKYSIQIVSNLGTFLFVNLQKLAPFTIVYLLMLNYFIYLSSPNFNKLKKRKSQRGHSKV